MIRKIAIAFLLLCPLGSFAQQPAADDLLAKARAVYDEQGARPALPQFEVALKAYREDGNRLGEAITIGLIGNCYKHLGDMDRALRMLETSLTMKRELKDVAEEAKTLNSIGLLYWEEGKFDDAATTYDSAAKAAQAAGNLTVQAAILNNLGLTHSNQGRYREALDDYQRALAAARSAKFDRGASDALGNIGGLYLDLGHYTEALKNYEESTRIAEQAGLKPSVMQNLGNTGLIYTAMGRIPEALDAFDRASGMAAEEGLKREEADWHKGKGTALAEAGEFDRAIAELRTAEHMYADSKAARQEVEVLNDIGDVYLSVGDIGAAEKQFQQASIRGAAIGYVLGTQSALISLAEIDQRRGRYDQAAAQLRTALEHARSSGDDGSVVEALIQLAKLERAQKNYSAAANNAAAAVKAARTAGAPLLQARAAEEEAEDALASGDSAAALAQIADAESLAKGLGDSELNWHLAYAKGRALEGNRRFDEAVEAYRNAVSDIEDVRDQLREERFRAGYLESRYDVYIALVRLLIRLHRFDEAFSFSEKLRARSYIDILNRDLSPSSTQLAELRARIRRLQDAVLSEETKTSEGERAVSDAYSDELNVAEARYEEVVDDLRARMPGWSLERGLLVSNWHQVSRALPRNAALLEYVVGPKSTALLCIAHQALHGTSVPTSSANLTAKIQLFRDLLRNPEGEDWRGPAASLYRELIQPAAEAGWLQGVDRLYIVPHGILHYLPFAALVHGEGPKARFLMQEYSIKLLPSASLLVVQRTPSTGPGTLLSVAPARAHLRFAVQEAESVVRLSPAGSFALIGDGATKQRFKRLAGSYELLHLATHGYFDRMNPMFSGIQLQPDASDDGMLHVYEIAGMKLHARLVTLSACETALGAGFYSDLPPGDEFVGLTRAFFSAGATSVMATLWEVNDQSTVKFMLDFYKRANRGDNAAALAAAQRSMAAAGRYQHPYYWAAFVLSGVGH